MIFLVMYVAAAKLRLVANVDGRLVILGNLSAIGAGVLSWLFLEEHFSSSNVFWLATVAAPIAFLGFCGIFILIGPANVDRSITFSILQAIKSLEGDETPKIKLIDAVPCDRILHKRLRELSTHGVIKLQDGHARLTPFGDRTRRFYLWLGRLLNIQPQ
jgi:hypothetical protein